MKQGKRKSLESYYIRDSFDSQSSHLITIPDVIQSLQMALASLNTGEIVRALNSASSLARGSLEMRENLRDTSASRLIASSFHNFTRLEVVCEAALQAMCLLIKDEEGAFARLHENIDAFTTSESCNDMVNILRIHVCNEQILAGVFVALDAISSSDERKTQLQATGMCTALVDVLNVQKLDIEVLTLGLRAAGTMMSGHNGNKKCFFDAGLGDVLVSIAKSNLKESTVLLHVTRDLLHLSSVPEREIRSLLGERGSVVIIIQIMKEHTGNRSFADLGCQFITNISNNNEATKALFFDLGICSLIAELVENYSDVPSVVNHVLHAITALSTRNVGYKEQFGDLGLSEVIVSLLHAYSKDFVITANCLRAISALSGFDLNKKRFAVVIPTIVNLMQSFANEGMVVEQCCLAIAFLHTAIDIRNPIALSEVAKGLSSVLSRHATSASVTEQACGAVVNLATSSPGAEVLGQVGLCVQMVAALKLFKDNLNVACSALKALLNLCVGSEGNIIRLNDGMIGPAVMDCLRNHTASEIRTELSCRLLLALLLKNHAAFLTQLAAARPSEIIVDILSEHMSNNTIVKLIYDILAEMGRHNAFAEKLVQADVMGYIVIATSEHLGDVGIVESACAAIGELSFHNHSDRENAGEAGICELLVEILEAHASRPLVAELCCCAIRNLSDLKSNVERFCANTSSLGIITRILKIHGSVPQVLTQCTLSIAALTFDNDSVIEVLGGLGVCDALLAVLTRYPADRALADAVLVAFVNLSANATNAKRLMELHAYTEVIESAHSHMENLILAEQALKFIMNLALLAEDSVSLLGAGGACGFVLAALELHDQEEIVAALAFKTITALTAGGRGVSNGSCFMKGNICELVVSCMKHYVERNRISDIICRAVIALTTNENRQSKFGRAGACEAVMDVIRTHVSHAKVIEQGCKLVHCLAYDHEENISRLALAGAAQLLNRCLVKYSENAGMCEAILKAMEAVAADRKFCLLFANAGVPELIQIVLDRHVGNPAVAAQTLRTISSIATHDKDLVLRFSNCRIEETVSELMTKHSTCGDVVVVASNLIVIMCSKHLPCILKFIKVGICESLIDSLTVFSANADISKSLLAAIPVILVDEDLVNRAYDRGVCEGISRALVNNLKDRVDLVVAALPVLTILCQESYTCCESLVNDRLCADLVEMVRWHVRAEDLDEEGCTILSSVCALIELTCKTIPASRAAFVSADITTVLLDFIAKVQENALATSECFRVITAVCRDSPDCTLAFDASGICEAVINGLGVFRDHVIAGEACCQLSLQLISHVSIQKKLIALKISELLLELIRTHPDHDGITEAGLKCITFIPPASDPFLCSPGAALLISTVVEVLEADVSIIEPTVQALKVLIQVLSVEFNKMSLLSSIERGTSPVCEAVFRRMMRFSRAADVCTHALVLIHRLSESVLMKRKWIGLGVCEAVVDSLGVHAHSSALVLSAFDVVHALGREKVSSSKFIVGVCDNFLSALKAHAASDAVVEHGLIAMCTLMTEVEGASFVKKFGAAGACELTAGLLKIHLKRESVAALCLQVLALLCLANENNRAKSVDSCDYVVAAMKRHCKGSVLVAESACRAIVALSPLESNRVRLGSGACEQIVEVMKNHVDSANVAECSCLAITKLTYKSEDNKAALHALGINNIILRLINRHKNDKNIKERGAEALQIFIEG